MKNFIILLAFFKLASLQYWSQDVVEYINNKIEKLLQANPARDILELKLNTEFNEERIKLKLVLFHNATNITHLDEMEAQQAIKRFSKYVTKFEDVVSQLKTASKELELLQENFRIPLMAKYKALLLQLELQDSESVREAEKILQRYQKFKRESSIAEDNVYYPPVMDEHRKYFEEILELLKKLSLHEDPKMQQLLQHLLSNPEQLKMLAEALRKLENENYYEDNDEDEDDNNLLNLFGVFLG